MMCEYIRKTVLDAIFQAVDEGLIHGTSGNIAMRDADDPNRIAITPSGIPYAGMTPGDISIVQMKEDGTNEWIDGPYKPSSEVPMHTAVMRARPDVYATVHTHSMYATICAMGQNPELKPLTPPHCEFYPIGIVDFGLPGADGTAEKVRDVLGENGRVCLIKNHGLFCCGKNMNAAMDAAIYTEEMAQTTVIAKMLGVYEPLPQKDVEAMQAMLAANLAV